MDGGRRVKIKGIRSRISALDVFIIILAVLCIAGIGLRIYMGTGVAASEVSGVSGDYEVFLLVSDIRTTSEQYFTTGSTFYLESGELLGSITQAPSITPARYITEDGEGNCVFVNAPENGDESMRDITLTLNVHGIMTERGFMTDSGTYLAPNITAKIRSEFIKTDALVMGIIPYAES